MGAVAILAWRALCKIGASAKRFNLSEVLQRYSISVYPLRTQGWGEWISAAAWGRIVPRKMVAQCLPATRRFPLFCRARF